MSSLVCPWWGHLRQWKEIVSPSSNNNAVDIDGEGRKCISIYKTIEWFVVPVNPLLKKMDDPSLYQNSFFFYHHNRLIFLNFESSFQISIAQNLINYGFIFRSAIYFTKK